MVHWQLFGPATTSTVTARSPTAGRMRSHSCGPRPVGVSVAVRSRFRPAGAPLHRLEQFVDDSPTARPNTLLLRITLGTCAGSALRAERPAGDSVRELRKRGRGHM